MYFFFFFSLKEAHDWKSLLEAAFSECPCYSSFVIRIWDIPVSMRWQLAAGTCRDLCWQELWNIYVVFFPSKDIFTPLSQPYSHLNLLGAFTLCLIFCQMSKRIIYGILQIYLLCPWSPNKMCHPQHFKDLNNLPTTASTNKPSTPSRSQDDILALLLQA